MSNKLATRPQEAKEFDGRKQDHGTKGTDRYRIATKKSRLILQKALEQVQPVLSIKDPVDRQEEYEYDLFVARTGVMDGFEESKNESRQKAIVERTAVTQEVAAGLDDYLNTLTPAELELEASRILTQNESDDNLASTSISEEEPDDDGPESMYILPTLEEAGGRTTKEIRKSMARAATLDTFEDDDFGDHADSHVRIRNNLR